MKTNQLIDQKARELKQYVGLAMSLDECEDFVSGVIDQVPQNRESTSIVTAEQLVNFLRQYQKSCEILHVKKIDAKCFVKNNYEFNENSQKKAREYKIYSRRKARRS